MSDTEDRVPFISPSPGWRTRAKEFRRRPSLLKQLAFFGILVIIAVPVHYFAFSTQDQVALSENFHSDPPAPSPSSSGHPHNLPSHKVRPHSTIPSDVVSAPSRDQAFNGTTTSSMAFSLITWGLDSAAEGAILLKSILMYTSGPVDLHIICNEEAQAYLEKRLALVHRPRYDVLVRFYRPTWQAMLDRIEREGTIQSVHAAGTPGLMKLFIHEILPPSVTKTVFVDTDAFFISDPHLLWEHFQHTLPPSTVVSMPTHPEMFAPQWFDANKICSCVMLMNLEGLRRLRLMDSSFYRGATPSPVPAYSPPAFRSLFGSPSELTGKYEDIALGDQSFWWAIIQYMNRDEEVQKGMFEHLHYDWEVSSCLLDMYITDMNPGKDDATEEDELKGQTHTWMTPHQGEVIMPKLVHFNCLPGPRYYEWPGWDSAQDEGVAGTIGLAQRWGTAIKYHVGYKWLWLNRGAERREPSEDVKSHRQPSGPRLTMETVTDVKFADELFGEPTA